MNPSTFGVNVGQKLEEGVDFSDFKVNIGQKLDLGVDSYVNSTPFWLFWPFDQGFNEFFTPFWLFWPSD